MDTSSMIATVDLENCDAVSARSKRFGERYGGHARSPFGSALALGLESIDALLFSTHLRTLARHLRRNERLLLPQALDLRYHQINHRAFL